MVRIHPFRFNPLRVKLFVYKWSMFLVDLHYSERSKIQPRQCLTVKDGEYGKVAQLVEQ